MLRFVYITERKQAEETVRQRTVQFDAAQRRPSASIWWMRFRCGRSVYRAPVFGDIPALIGRDFDEVIHRLWSQAFADEIVRPSATRHHRRAVYDS